MSEKEKKILKNLAENLDIVPENKKEYLMGIGEGLRLAKEKKEEGNEG